MKKVTDELYENNTDFQNITLIPSSKRAKIFLKNSLKNKSKTTSFLPKISSIEEFIEEISEINQIDTTEILFQFYQIYLKNTKKENQETFDKFISWASIVLNDFNELDRYLIDADKIFDYLSDIRRIEEWFQEKEITKLSKNYINYFKNIKKYYRELSNTLLQQNKAYSGLVFKKAFENLDNFIQKNKIQQYIFIGLNALTKSEEKIIQKLLFEKKAKIYFDVDNFLLTNNKSYGKFITKYKENWSYFATLPFKSISDDYKNEKNIEIIGVPKNVTQIKEASSILKKISKQNNNLQNTALVLANEQLLPIALNSLPNEVSKVNITMGYALKNIHTASFFKSIFNLYKNKNRLNLKDTFYYKDVIAILKNNTIQTIFKKNKIDIKSIISDKILKVNLIFLTKKQILTLTQFSEINSFFNLLFLDTSNGKIMVANLISAIEILKKTSNDFLETEYLNRFYSIFNQIQLYNSQFPFIKNIETLDALFNQLLETESLSFKGEPLEGLQIMGMLETRNLDFENIIITSVNEGFLPSGKKSNSFIPFDVKKEIGLPTYSEKDAVFSYHFFRLLQRAKNVYLLYNTETDDFGASEKSRFLLQLEQYAKQNPKHHITHKIVSPISTLEPKKLLEIPKNQQVIQLIENYNQNKGFSPSALTTYIANPIYFYQQRVLGIKDIQEIEETIATNTLGTIIHDVLEDAYKPLLNKILLKEDIEKIKKEVPKKTLHYFKKHVKNGKFNQGKNLLIFEIAKQYIYNFLETEIASLNKGNKIIVIGLEKELKGNITIFNNTKTINLRGIADRIERFNGALRIIDYKTGTTKQTTLNKKNWELTRTNYKSYSKRFQLMFYAYCYVQMENINIENTSIESGIISFKNLKEGFLKVDNTLISIENLQQFKHELQWLLEEIYALEKPFIENPNPPF